MNKIESTKHSPLVGKTDTLFDPQKWRFVEPKEVSPHEALGWMIDFMKKDIDQLSTGQFFNLSLDFLKYVEKIVPRSHVLEQKYTLLRGDLKGAQSELLSYFEKNIEPWLISEISNGRQRELPVPKNLSRRWLWKENGTITVVNEFLSASDSLKTEFIDVLHSDYYSINDFTRCELCGNWIYSTRKKRFCSHVCNSRFNSAQARARLKIPPLQLQAAAKETRPKGKGESRKPTKKSSKKEA